MTWWDAIGEFSKNQDILKNLGIDLRAVIVQFFVMGIMLVLVKKIFWKPLKEALDDRTRYVENTYQQAEDLKSEMERVRDEYQEKLAAAEAESRERIQAAVAEAKLLAARIVADARDQAQEIKDRTAAEMARERDRMLLELRTHVVDLALQAAEHVTRETMTNERNRALVQAFVEETGVA
jgi:F-type H+-transporting ATPase subunit b